jgi:CBS domain-containing protein
MQVKDLMTRNVRTVQEDDGVREICTLLTKHKISGIPVVGKAGKLKGFVSERDIIAAVPKKHFTTMKARQLMSRKVCSVPSDAPLTHASKLFSQKKFRLLPVLKAGKLVGIIARKDIVQQMIGHYY